jgi:hypothetical protein
MGIMEDKRTQHEIARADQAMRVNVLFQLHFVSDYANQIWKTLSSTRPVLPDTAKNILYY